MDVVRRSARRAVFLAEYLDLTWFVGPCRDAVSLRVACLMACAVARGDWFWILLVLFEVILY